MSCTPLGPVTADVLIKRNLQYAEKHLPIPTLAELRAKGVGVPHTVILTCCDPRCKPERFLDIEFGEGVFVMRNVGGRVSTALKDIVALDAFLRIDEIMVVHHTDCGASHFKDEGIRDALRARMPEGHHQDIEKMTFGAFDDFAQSVIDDINILRNDPYVRPELAEKAYGFVYNIKSGKLETVKA